MARGRGAAVAAAPGRPARRVALVDWADEEGARFGRSLLGSSAFAGHAGRRGRARADATPTAIALPDALAAHGVDVDAMAARGRGAARAPRGLPRAAHRAGAGAGGRGPAVRRGARHASGSSATGWCSPAAPAHAGSTPMDRRADAGVAAAARPIVGLQEIARAPRRRVHGRAGRLRARASSPPCRAAPSCWSTSATSTPGALAAMLRRRARAVAEAAAAEGCTVEAERIWRDRAGAVRRRPGRRRRARRARGGRRHREALPSGALHDAARAGAASCPAAMVFSSSTGASATRRRRTRPRPT